MNVALNVDHYLIQELTVTEIDDAQLKVFVESCPTLTLLERKHFLKILKSFNLLAEAFYFTYLIVPFNLRTDFVFVCCAIAE